MERKGAVDKQAMTQFISSQESCQELQYPMVLKVMTERETKEYHLKKLFELSKLERSKLEYRVDRSIWKDGKPIIEKPTYWQKSWVVHKLKAPASSWRSFA